MDLTFDAREQEQAAAAPRSASSERRPTWPSGAPCRRASRLRPRAGSGRRAPGALWLRQDLPREQGLEYWRGTHARIACETPGWLEYRQHHFDPDEPGLWPDLAGVETSIGKAGRMDGVAEVTFEHAASPLKGMRSRKAIFEGERNVFARTIAYMTGPSGGRWWREGRGEPVGFRTVVMGGDVRGFGSAFSENGSTTPSAARLTTPQACSRCARRPSCRFVVKAAIRPSNACLLDRGDETAFEPNERLPH